MLGLALASKIFADYERFLIVTHEDPDGDALGSSLALQRGLSTLGRQADVACRDQPAPPFRFLPDIEQVQHDFLLGDYEALVVIDCGDLVRSGFAERIVEFRRRGKPVVNIDHHPKNDLYRVATVNLVDTDVAASAQIVMPLLSNLEVDLSADLATQLLTGLYTDTGGFKHSNTTPQVLSMASTLLSAGARLKKIVTNVAATRSLTALKLWGVALSRVRRHPDLPLATSFVTQEDLNRCQAAASDLGGVVNMINSVPGTQAAVLFTELPDGEVKVSVRTESEGVDVARIATLFGGGGHKKAAGFRLCGRVREEKKGWRIVSEENYADVVERQTRQT